MLTKLRNEIDRIDEQLISLLKQRMKVVRYVGELKKKNGEKFFIRSAREADMVKALIKKAAGDLPESLVVDVWRKLITAANMCEQPLHIVSQHPEYEYLVREYYNSEVPITHFLQTKDVIAELDSGRAQIAIFALPPHHHEEWWKILPTHLRVFVRIPFIKKSATRLVAVANKEPEESSENVTLIATENGVKEVKGFCLESKEGMVLGHY
ncbi:MAG: hypothetical protein FJX34_06040 [Alphaproteobacteria bacterium]|nr:hypothetical protein [Alphaproteobacteria bacterium]